VVAVLHFAAFAEESVCLIEEQDGASVFSRVEQPAQVLLRLADVLIDDRRQIDSIEPKLQLIGKDLRGHCLAGPALTREQRINAETSRASCAEASRFINAPAVAHLRCNLGKEFHFGFGQYEAVPRGLRFYSFG